MCFGRRAPDVIVQAPKLPDPEPIKEEVKEAPKELTPDYKPLQTQQYLGGVQQAGSAQRRASMMAGRGFGRRRQSLSTGIASAGGTFPTGGINL